MNYLKKLRFITGFLVLMTVVIQVKAQQFAHPGLLQNNEDLERMKKGIAAGQGPVYEGFMVFQAHPQSSSAYSMQGPMQMVGRNPTVGQTIYDADANAAYQNALMWALTGKQAYADKAKEIVNAWSARLESITGRDAVLMAGLGPFKMVNAAEILRYTHSGWSAADIRLAEKHFKEVIYPVIKDFSPFANGNWDSAAIKTVMAIGIFCNDRPVFERALQYYTDGTGDGRLTNYIINEAGQCQESGRDQGHTQLGIAHLGDCAEMAWHQGLNLYAYADNRLLKGFEYTAKYNLGQEVPYVPAMDRTGKYLHEKISEDTRGKIRAVYEQIYNHYVNRMGMAAPYTQQAAEKIRPEPQGLPGADHVGFGTLLYSRPAGSADGNVLKTAPAAPGGLIASTSAKGGNVLTWVEAIGASQYTVKRAVQKRGPYVILAKDITSSTYKDSKALTGKTYYYSVSASNKNGESENAYAASITTALPAGWKSSAIGAVKVKGYVAFDGSGFTIEGSGMGIDSTSDELQFVYKSLNGDGTITARYVPQVSSQFSSFGLAMREGLTGNAAQVSLILKPESSRQVEAPGWYIKMFNRNTAGAAAKIAGTSDKLAAPVVTFSRLTGYCWFRLQRKGNEFTGFFSVDGKNWIKTGSVTAALKKQLYVGLPVSSGVASITTRLSYDNVVVKAAK